MFQTLEDFFKAYSKAYELRSSVFNNQAMMRNYYWIVENLVEEAERFVLLKIRGTIEEK